MPGTPTTRAGLPGPVGPDPAWVPGDLDLLRNRADLVFAMYAQGAYGSEGAATTSGVLRYTNNLGPNGSFLYADGTAWRPVSPVVMPKVTVTGNITLGLGHAGCCIVGDASSGTLAVTVPPDSTAAFPHTPDMTVIQFHQINTVAITFVAGSGVTINPEPGHSLATRGRYSWAGLVHTAVNTWSLIGGVA